MYDSYTVFSNEINFIYNENFSITEDNAVLILKFVNQFESAVIEYEELNNSIFHTRLVSDSDTIDKILLSVYNIKVFLNDCINKTGLSKHELDTNYLITLVNRVQSLMYEVEHNRVNSSNSIINDYIKYFMIFIAFFLVFCLVLLVILLYELKQKDFKIQETSKLLNYTIKGQEEEKRRIARELHDTVAQDMRYIIQLTKKLDTNPVQSELVDKEDLILKEVRNLCSSFIPQDIENKDLVSSLKDIITRIQTQTNMEIKVTILNDINFKNMSDERFLNFYRIIQEILNNAEKHSKATEISILIKEEKADEKRYIHLIVTDDGVGIDKAILDSIKEQKIITTKNHFGLKNIIQRVQLLNGKIQFTSDKEFGTEISVIFPELNEKSLKKDKEKLLKEKKEREKINKIEEI